MARGKNRLINYFFILVVVALYIIITLLCVRIPYRGTYIHNTYVDYCDSPEAYYSANKTIRHVLSVKIYKI